MTEELPVPLKRPVASQRQVRAWLKQLGAEMLTPPWHIVPQFHYLKKGQYPDPEDVKCYAFAETYPQYHKVVVTVGLDHPGWKDEGDILTCLRHEVFHSFFGGLNDVLTAVAPEALTNDASRMLLDNAEDEAVNRLAAMPIFNRRTDGTQVQGG